MGYSEAMERVQVSVDDSRFSGSVQEVVAIQKNKKI